MAKPQDTVQVAPINDARVSNTGDSQSDQITLSGTADSYEGLKFVCFNVADKSKLSSSSKANGRVCFDNLSQAISLFKFDRVKCKSDYPAMEAKATVVISNYKVAKPSEDPDLDHATLVKVISTSKISCIALSE